MTDEQLKELERQISQLKEKYKKDKQNLKAKCKKLNQQKKDMATMREHLVQTLPERHESILDDWKKDIAQRHNKGHINELDRAS